MLQGTAIIRVSKFHDIPNFSQLPKMLRKKFENNSGAAVANSRKKTDPI